MPGLNDEARGRFDKIDTSISKLFDIQRETSKQIADHIYVSGVRDAEMKAKADSAHDKAEAAQDDIDEHMLDHKCYVKEKRAARWLLWITLIGAFAAAIFAVIKVTLR